MVDKEENIYEWRLDLLSPYGHFKPFPIGIFDDSISHEENEVLRDVEILIWPAIDTELVDDPERYAIEVTAWYGEENVGVPLIDMIKRGLGACGKKKEIKALAKLVAGIKEIIVEIEADPNYPE